MKIFSYFNIFLFYTEVILLILGQLGRVKLNWAINFYILEVIVFIHVFYCIFYALLIEQSKAESRSTTKNFSITSIMKFILRFCNDTKNKMVSSLINLVIKDRIIQLPLSWIAFCVFVLLLQSSSYSTIENIRAFSYLLRIINFILFAYIVMPSIPQKVLHTSILITSIFVSGVALLQYVFLPDLRFIASYGWDPHMYRAVGTIFDPPIMGSVLGMLFMYKIIKINKYKNIEIEKYKSIKLEKYRTILSNTAILILLYFSIIFLYSRSTYLAIFFAVNYIFWINRKYSLLFLFIIFYLWSVYLAPHTIPEYKQLESAKIERISTVTSRKTEILAGLVAFAKNPIWGVGFNRVREYKESSKFQIPSSKSNDVFAAENYANHAGSAYHSFWVTILATTGIVGTLLLMYFGYSIVYFTPVFAPVLFIPVFIGFFDNTLFHPFVIFALLMLYFSMKTSANKNYD